MHESGGRSVSYNGEMVDPLPVSIVDTPFDLLGLLSSVAGVVGLFIAIWALWVSYRQGRKAEREAAKERRSVFELGILRDLLTEVNARGAEAVREPIVVALLSGIPDRDLPLLRGCKQANDEGQVWVGTWLNDKLNEYGDRYPAGERISQNNRAKFALMDEIQHSMKARVIEPSPQI